MASKELSTALKPSLLAKALDAYFDANVSVFVTGAPGIGKSAIIHQTAARRNWSVIDVRAVLLDPVDVRGLPHINPMNGKAAWAVPTFLPDAERDGPEGVLFLDELPQAAPAVQSALFSLVLDRKVGEYQLPLGWRVAAAGNRREDRSGVNRVHSALNNRFVHLDQIVDLDDWTRWALGAGLRTEVIAFIRFRPELLHKFDPDQRQNPTPRTWEMVSKILDANPPAELEHAMLAGAVGDGPAAEIVGFLRIFRKLPSIDGVLLNPDTAEVPKDPATLYALCGGLARKATPANFDAVVTYANRMPAEFSVVVMKDSAANRVELQQTRAFAVWASRNSDVLF